MESFSVAKYTLVEGGNAMNDEEMNATPVTVSVADEICSASPWTDTYFDGDSSVIAVFDIDYEAYRQLLIFQSRSIAMLLLYTPVVWAMAQEYGLYGFTWLYVCSVLGTAVLVHRKLSKELHMICDIHVALTSEGIRQDLVTLGRHSTLVCSTIPALIDPCCRIPMYLVSHQLQPCLVCCVCAGFFCYRFLLMRLQQLPSPRITGQSNAAAVSSPVPL
jgi:hypothetical protein